MTAPPARGAGAHAASSSTASGCLMEFLRRELDDPGAAPCGRCARCLGRHVVDVARSTATSRATRSSSSARQWLDARAAQAVADRSRIAAEERAEAGPGAVRVRRRRLGRDGEGPEGGRQLRRRAGRRARANSCDSGSSTPPPTWVTCVPSLRHPELVPSFAARLADAARAPVPSRSWPRPGRPRPRRRWTTAPSSSATSHEAFGGHRARARRARSSSSTTSSTRAGR